MHRAHTVRVQALFQRKAPASQASGGSGAAEIFSTAKRFNGPSQAGNDAIANAVASLKGRVNTNPKSPQFTGAWKILYASGRSGLTALDGEIAKFTVGSDGSYENECATKVIGIIPGYAKEGGKLSVTGSNKYELYQEYQEFKKGPGGVALDEVEGATVRAFQVLYLDDSVLVTKLQSTRYVDEESGRPVTVTPDDDYFLVWQKEGAPAPAVAAGGAAPIDAGVEVEEEEADAAPARGGRNLFGGLGTAIIGRKDAQGLATMAERSAGAVADSGNRRAQQMEAAEQRRQAAEARKQAQQQEQEGTRVVGKGSGFSLGSLFGGGDKGGDADDGESPEDVRERKRQEAEERRAAAAEAAERKRQEAEDRRQAQRAKREAKRQQQRAAQGGAADDDEDSGTRILPKGFGLGGLFGGGKGGADKDEDDVPARQPARRDAATQNSKAGTASGGGGLGGLFGGRKAAAAQGDRPMTAEERRAAAAEERERKRAEAEERKRAQAEAAEQRRAEAEARKQAEAQARAEADARRREINETLAEMTQDARESGAAVKELQAALRAAERESKDAVRAGEAARQRLEGLEAQFNAAEAALDEANAGFNGVAAQLRDKQGEASAAAREVRALEDQLVKL